VQLKAQSSWFSTYIGVLRMLLLVAMAAVIDAVLMLTTSHVLWLCVVTADTTWQLIGESALQFDHALLSSASTDALLLDCTGGELYLHIGEDCSDDDRAAAKDAAIAYRYVVTTSYTLAHTMMSEVLLCLS
jgi:hypothetical protein